MNSPEKLFFDETSIYFGVKHLICAFFPNSLCVNKHWLYCKLFDFEINYAFKSEMNMIEEFRVKLKENDEKSTNTLKRSNNYDTLKA